MIAKGNPIIRRSIIRSIIVLLVLGIGIAFYFTDRPVPPWERYGIELIPIPAGNFEMGDDDARFKKSNPRHTVSLESYSIAKNLVTVKQYDAFCVATRHARPSPGQMNTNWNTIDQNGFWRRLPSQLQPYFDPNWGRKHDSGEYPVTNVNWEDANAYCQWLSQQSGRTFTLPSEAQWEKAARGTDGRLYPWGNKWDPNKCANGLGTNCPTGTMPVGSYPSGASPYGVQDMAGNAWQWCTDSHARDFPNTSHSRSPIDPAKSRSGVLRGGSWYEANQFNFHCANRACIPPDVKTFWIGFRCVTAGLSR